MRWAFNLGSHSHKRLKPANIVIIWTFRPSAGRDALKNGARTSFLPRGRHSLLAILKAGLAESRKSYVFSVPSLGCIDVTADSTRKIEEQHKVMTMHAQLYLDRVPTRELKSTSFLAVLQHY